MQNAFGVGNPKGLSRSQIIHVLVYTKIDKTLPYVPMVAKGAVTSKSLFLRNG